MDPISSSASVITIIECIFKTVHIAGEIWRAPAELERLSKELASLNTVAETLYRHTNARKTFDGGAQLFQAQLRLEIAHETFRQKLRPRQGTSPGKPSFARRKWITEKHTIDHLARELQHIKNDLSMQIGMMLLNTEDVVPNRLENDIVACFEDDKDSFALVADDIAMAQSGCDDGSEFPGSCNDYSRSKNRDAFQEAEDMCLCCPLGVLEGSSLFFPETYVIRRAPQLDMIVFSLTELYRTVHKRVDRYCLLFNQDGRRWKHVTVQITIENNVPYPRVTNPILWRQYTTVPGVIEWDLWKLLRNIEMYKSTTKVKIELKVSGGDRVGFDQSEARISESTDNREDISNLAKFIEAMRYQNLHQYLESEVIVLKRRHSFFLVLVRSILCIEMKMPFTEEPMPEGSNLKVFASCLQKLQSAQGCPGVAVLEGVVLSDDRNQVCSYLVRAPSQGPVEELLRRAQQADALISWRRRERWIRQLLAIVAELHQRGICGIFASPCLTAFWVDANDDLQITNLSSSVLYSGRRYHQSSMTPPELYLRPGTHMIDSPSAFSHQTDIFYLGHMVLRIAEHRSLNNYFCRSDDCAVQPRYTCTTKHGIDSYMSALTDKQIPTYITQIVAQCQHEAPNDRRPAAELLRLLPSIESPEESCESVQLSNYHALTNGPIDPSCDACDKYVGDVQYHCHVCYSENFDLCSECVESGVTCLDIRHLLTRRVWKDGIPIHSSTYIQTGVVDQA